MKMRPAARVHELQQRLATVTRGEGALDTRFDHYRPVPGPIATGRGGTTTRSIAEYLLQVARRVAGAAHGA